MLAQLNLSEKLQFWGMLELSKVIIYLDGITNEEILIGSNAEEMAKNIITLLTDMQEAEQIAQAGYDFTNRVYDWGKATEVLERLWRQLLATTNELF